MKPKKNQIYCPISCRPKMVFETREKAENFIRFNAADFEDSDTIPRRPYWCSGCGGWHLSSKDPQSCHYGEGEAVEVESIDTPRDDEFIEVDGETYVPYKYLEKKEKIIQVMKERKNKWEEKCKALDGEIIKLKHRVTAYKAASLRPEYPEWLPLSNPPELENRYYPILLERENGSQYPVFAYYKGNGVWCSGKVKGQDISRKVLAWYPYLYTKKEE